MTQPSGTISKSTASIHLNPLAAARDACYPFANLLSVERARQWRTQLAQCPRYAPTPLHRLRDIEERAAIDWVLYKDEGPRMGLGSFKALGGTYAAGLLLARCVSEHLGRSVSVAEIAYGSHRELTRNLTLACATDGNHGRAVAAGARLFGAQCVIFLHAGVSASREAAIAALGARTVRVPGDYDDSVEAATATAAEHGWYIVSDTSWPGYERVPVDVMQGYTILVDELLEQQRACGYPLPTHVFLQGGVGGLAAAVTAHLWEALPARPWVIVVEPVTADCLYQSALAGTPRPASGNLDTVMAGLSCGEVSLVAWEVLRNATDAFMTISDRAAVDAMRILARADAGRPAIVAGESATAGMAALLLLAGDAHYRRALGLERDSCVLLIGTEGATDPELYEKLIADAPEIP